MVRLLALTVLCVLTTARPSGAQEEALDTILVSGRPVAYHVVGSGQGVPLVVINGGPGLPHDYLHQSDVWTSLGSSRRVVFFDQPGTGHSWRLGAGDSLAVSDLTAVIDRLREHLGVDRVALLGHSFGGFVALSYAIEYPTRVDRLALVSSPAATGSDSEFLFEQLWPDSMARSVGQPALRIGDSLGLTQDIKRHFAMGFYSPRMRSQVLGRVDSVDFSADQFLLLYQSIAIDLTASLRGIRVPTLVATGRFDANVSPRTAWRLREAMPHASWWVWEESGHYPMIEEPDSFARVIGTFLSAP